MNFLPLQKYYGDKRKIRTILRKVRTIPVFKIFIPAFNFQQCNEGKSKERACTMAPPSLCRLLFSAAY
ncbi:hypothetical protein A9970_07585 [Sphingobacterium sp. UME9]|nr:hypothetical protein [Sphingobacterium sp. UME9]